MSFELNPNWRLNWQCIHLKGMRLGELTLEISVVREGFPSDLSED